MVRQVPVEEMIASELKPLPIRARFYKVGMLQYISHLDLMRTMTRIITRSGLPIWYSQGFNPRLKLTFAMPLSIGTQSRCEFFDIRLTAPVALDEVRDRLNSALTDEMQIEEVYISDLKFNEIGWAEYELRMTSPSLTDATVDALRELYTSPLVVTKRTKTGDKEVDISPYIRLCSVEHVNDGENSIVLTVRLCADSANYLNPEYLVKAAREKLGLVFEDPFTEYYTITRREVFLADGETIFR